jgi:hypothetical protein
VLSSGPFWSFVINVERTEFQATDLIWTVLDAG